jgi:hypothetical protein
MLIMAHCVRAYLPGYIPKDARLFPFACEHFLLPRSWPHYLHGDLLTVCSNATPAPGKAVIALVRGQYVCMRVNADGDLYANHGEIIAHGSYSVAVVVLDRSPRE